jgi:hypothetical protein
MAKIFTQKSSTFTSLLSGSGTYTPPANAKFLKIRMVGGGGGGSGGGNSGGTGGNGTNTTFGSSLLIATGGNGSSAVGIVGASVSGTINAPAAGFVVLGGNGTGGQTSSSNNIGSIGGSSPFGGAGAGLYQSPGNPGQSNTGGGGGGGAASAASGGYTGTGGNAAGYVEALVPVLLSSYAFSIGTGGTGGTPTANAFTGGAGGSGVIIIEEIYD